MIGGISSVSTDASFLGSGACTSVQNVSTIDSSILKGLLARIEHLESQSDKTRAGVRVEILGKVFSSVHDVRSFLSAQGPNVSHGGFIDIFNMYKRLSVIHGGGIFSGSSSAHEDSEDVKYRKSLQDVSLSEDEHVVELTFENRWIIPKIFLSSNHSNKTAKTELIGLPTYSSWKNRSDDTGTGYFILRQMENQSVHWNAIIESTYSDFPEIRLLAAEVKQKSSTFIRSLDTWIEATYDNLVSGGQDSKDVWWIITKVMRSLFEDCLSKQRAQAKPSPSANKSERAAAFIWGSLLTYQSICEVLDKDIKGHHIVTGAYNQWSVQNSGRKEAKDALSQVQSLRDKLAKSEAALNKVLIEISACQKSSEAAKKIADRALQACSNKK